ncbi:hypothetical protein FQN50_004035 [Emmonsiellopsis sp. PD_5]|nr:hypothetical protein FQN50_004035 [Emmonsiellopsis sp. PD_5]
MRTVQFDPRGLSPEISTENHREPCTANSTPSAQPADKASNRAKKCNHEATAGALLMGTVVVGGSIPMLFVLFTTAPFVNHVYLAIPTIAQQTRQRTQAYLKNVPRDATLNIETMKLNFYPRRTEVSLQDLIPARSRVRPVSFAHTKPEPQPWWKGKSPIHFYAPEKSKHGSRATLKYFPEVWEGVFAKIKANQPPKT